MLSSKRDKSPNYPPPPTAVPLTKDGRILLFFGSSGDINYLNHLIEQADFSKVVVNHSEHEKNGIPVEYVTYRLERK